MKILDSIDTAVFIEDGVPNGIIDEFLDALATAGFEVVSERRKPTPFAALHWFIPTAVVVFLSRKLFDSFLTEAGKDLYGVFKRSFLGLAKRTTELRPIVVTTRGKVPESWVPPTLSVIAVLNDDRRAVFIFSPELADDAREAATVSMMTVVRRHQQEKLPLPELGVALDGSIARWGSIPLIYDVGTHSWRAVTQAD